MANCLRFLLPSPAEVDEDSLFINKRNHCDPFLNSQDVVAVYYK